MVDILNVDLNYQMMITELNGLHNDRGLVLPGVHFSLMIDLDTQNLSSTYIASFLTNVLSNLSNIDFDLYCGSQAQKKNGICDQRYLFRFWNAGRSESLSFRYYN